MGFFQNLAASDLASKRARYLAMLRQDDALSQAVMELWRLRNSATKPLSPHYFKYYPSPGHEEMVSIPVGMEEQVEARHQSRQQAIAYLESLPDDAFRVVIRGLGARNYEQQIKDGLKAEIKLARTIVIAAEKTPQFEEHLRRNGVGAAAPEMQAAIDYSEIHKETIAPQIAAIEALCDEAENLLKPGKAKAAVKPKGLGASR